MKCGLAACTSSYLGRYLVPNRCSPIPLWRPLIDPPLRSRCSIWYPQRPCPRWPSPRPGREKDGARSVLLGSKIGSQIASRHNCLGLCNLDVENPGPRLRADCDIGHECLRLQGAGWGALGPDQCHVVSSRPPPARCRTGYTNFIHEQLDIL